MDIKFTAVIVLITSLMTSNLCLADKSYSFAVVPQQSASKLARLWVPILNHVSKESGINLRFKTAKNIPTFETELAAENYDIAYMNPYHYTVFHESANYHAIAKAKDKVIRGIVVAGKNSPYQSLEDLQGLTIAFPSPYAFAASMLPQAELQKRNISITPKYVSSHDSVYRNIAQKRLPAGGGIIRTFNNTEKTIHDELKIIWTSKGYTPHAIAVHSRIPEEDIRKIQQALNNMSDTAEGKKLLQKIRIKGFETASNPDWNDVRELKLQQ